MFEGKADFSDPDYPLNEMFGPFQGQGNIRPYYFPIETRLDYNEADKTLSQLKPKVSFNFSNIKKTIAMKTQNQSLIFQKIS